MGSKTKIDWCDATWSPWIGCTKVHVGCKNCYAEAMFDRRMGRAKWGPGGTRLKMSSTYWRQPIKWDLRRYSKLARGLNPPPYRVFPSLCDPFEDREDLRHMRRDFFNLISSTTELTWILLTKRPQNIRPLLTAWAAEHRSRADVPPDASDDVPTIINPNLHVLYSASNQKTLEEGLPHLLDCHDLVPVLGLCLEPLLGPVDMQHVCIGQSTGLSVLDVTSALPGYSFGYEFGYQTGEHPIDWVVVGGESGPNARPCNIEWVRDIMQQCEAAEAFCFIKQLGSHVVDGSRSRLQFKHRKGGDLSEWPEDLKVQEFPKEINNAITVNGRPTDGD